MIDLANYLNRDLIIHDLGKCTREEAIKTLVGKIYISANAEGLKVEEETAAGAVLERESQQSTGIGNGLAFPHARIDGWEGLSIVMGISSEGIDFDSLDKEPVKYVCLLISSTEEPYLVLQTMSTLIRFFVEDGYGKKILEEGFSAQDIISALKKRGVREEEQILAGDIVRPLIASVSPDTSLEEAAKKMHLKHLDVLPVIDDDGRYHGEVSCLDIFKYGMPDFFYNLNTISFVRHIDPFEKYFRIKEDIKVKDIYHKGTSTVSKDITLLEIIFEMTVKKRSKLFVVGEDEKLLGVIDRFCVIDKILFF